MPSASALARPGRKPRPELQKTGLAGVSASLSHDSFLTCFLWGQVIESCGPFKHHPNVRLQSSQGTFRGCCSVSVVHCGPSLLSPAWQLASHSSDRVRMVVSQDTSPGFLWEHVLPPPDNVPPKRNIDRFDRISKGAVAARFGSEAAPFV